MLIDCDIHVGYETVRDLLPYLDGATAETRRAVGDQRTRDAVLSLVSPDRLAAPGRL